MVHGIDTYQTVRDTRYSHMPDSVCDTRYIGRREMDTHEGVCSTLYRHITQNRKHQEHIKKVSGPRYRDINEAMSWYTIQQSTMVSNVRFFTGM